jgi:hypothetical protein
MLRTGKSVFADGGSISVEADSSHWVQLLFSRFSPKLYTMRRFLILFFALHIFTGNMLVAELWKIPFLVQHFQLYQRFNPGSTVLNFINLHYADAAHRSSDPAHRQLPLQYVSSPTVVSTILPEIGCFELSAPIIDQYRTIWVLDNKLLPSDFRVRLLRPPRCLFGPVA